jgi:hypothetical protein
MRKPVELDLLLLLIAKGFSEKKCWIGARQSPYSATALRPSTVVRKFASGRPRLARSGHLTRRGSIVINDGNERLRLLNEPLVKNLQHHVRVK